MELWLSSSTGTYTLLDQNKQTVAYNGGYYNAVLENLPNGYNQYSFTPSQDVFDVILLDGYDIRQVNVFGQVVNTISITGGDKTFRAYDVVGRIYVPSYGDDQFVYLGIIWVELPTIPTMGNIFNITYYFMLF